MSDEDKVDRAKVVAEGLLMAMLISDLFGDKIVSDNMDDPEIIGLSFKESEYGEEIEPVMYDKTLIDPPKNSNKLEGEK
tara:strand:+ start:858 stop:1094 length:237 start_codon:yes stop_codon:yes gene_type:complete